jgi:hypothetical protein
MDNPVQHPAAIARHLRASFFIETEEARDDNVQPAVDDISSLFGVRLPEPEVAIDDLDIFSFDEHQPTDSDQHSATAQALEDIFNDKIPPTPQNYNNYSSAIETSNTFKQPSLFKRIGQKAISLFKRNQDSGQENNSKIQKRIAIIGSTAVAVTGFLTYQYMQQKSGVALEGTDMQDNIFQFFTAKTQQITNLTNVLTSEEFQRMVDAPEAFQSMIDWASQNPHRDIQQVFESPEFQSMARWIEQNPDRDIQEVFNSEAFARLAG